jgi:hypothetical protein
VQRKTWPALGYGGDSYTLVGQYTGFSGYEGGV